MQYDRNDILFDRVSQLFFVVHSKQRCREDGQIYVSDGHGRYLESNCILASLDRLCTPEPKFLMIKGFKLEIDLWPNGLSVARNGKKIHVAIPSIAGAIANNFAQSFDGSVAQIESDEDAEFWD